ncbi:hypothetical protein AMK59_1696 [Oryctes borbonicus]|uniref:Endoplasmic reticulum junction formation protein lunapark n=1 Tax=Oryctes borbonicus TaxID=1629725 RepID=A0A0T6BCI7_9SCAR|nr:hypothetical protein AMK59_1696 [Oryctes borbonicus]
MKGSLFNIDLVLKYLQATRMGIVITKFRKKKTTEEILEKLDKEIKTIETYRANTEQTQKKIVGRFILISVIVYTVTAFLFYFYFFPASFYDRLFYIIPLIFAPVIIISTKKSLTWYYKRKITKNQMKLRKLSDEKKTILENVMETETYKKAKIILEKYAPEQIRRSNNFSVPLTDAASPDKNSMASNIISPAPGLRHRALPSIQPYQVAKTSYSGLQQTPARPLAITPFAQPVKGISSTSLGSVALFPPQIGVSGTPLPLPRTILPRDRSVFDKMVEYLVGDGPSNRYALICKQCSSHNGMALKEEFEYLSFRCCYCYFLNPARKKRPPAPKLEIEGNQQLSIQSADTSESEKNSSTDTDSDQDAKSLQTSNHETVYSKEKEPSSDSEKYDFDVLSDAEFKHSDTETTPIEIDNAEVSNTQTQRELPIQAENDSEIKE